MGLAVGLAVGFGAVAVLLLGLALLLPKKPPPPLERPPLERDPLLDLPPPLGIL